MLKKSAAATVIVLAALAVVFSGCLSAQADRAQQQDAPRLIRARVTSVTDGDTIRARVNGRSERIRLIGVNAPERRERGGREAHEFARTHLNRKTVWLELDTRERDRHGRLLAYVWLRDPAGTGENQVRSHMFNARLLLEGHAQVMTVPPNVKYADMFVAFQRDRR